MFLLPPKTFSFALRRRWKSLMGRALPCLSRPYPSFQPQGLSLLPLQPEDSCTSRSLAWYALPSRFHLRESDSSFRLLVIMSLRACCTSGGMVKWVSKGMNPGWPTYQVSFHFESSWMIRLEFFHLPLPRLAWDPDQTGPASGSHSWGLYDFGGWECSWKLIIEPALLALK